MVNSFIIADANCKVLYSSVFSFSTDANKREEIINSIVQNVKREFDFNSAVSSNTSNDYSENSPIDIESKGIFNTKVGDIQKPVVWHSFYGCLYILVCDNTENRILAASTLFNLIRTIRDNLPKVMNSPVEIVYRADAVSLIINTLLPCGQLLFLNNQATLQVTRDIQKNIR